MRSFFATGRPERYDKVHEPAPCVSKCILATYRAVSTALTAATMGVLLYREKATFFLSYTNWALTLTLLCFALLLITVLTKRQRNPFHEDDSLDPLDSAERELAEIAFQAVRKRKSPLALWRVALVFLEIALTSQLIVTFSYWTLLHESPAKGDSLGTVLLYAVHLMPAILLLGEFALDSVVFKPAHGVYLAVAYAAYVATNCVATIKRG